jgi:hypothetical protein
MPYWRAGQRAKDPQQPGIMIRDWRGTPASKSSGFRKEELWIGAQNLKNSSSEP